MIVLVKLSARRYVVIDTPHYESAWTTNAVRGWAQAEDDGVVYASGNLIAGPADITTCYAAMAKHAAENKALVRHAEWEHLQQVRADAVKAANVTLQASRKAEGRG
jgi:hypothetical protein